MAAQVHSGTLVGIECIGVRVETELFAGLRRFSMVGLADNAGKEAKERVRCALENSAFGFPRKEVVVNLAPASLPKSGTQFDLAIALGILVAEEKLHQRSLSKTLVTGELQFDGSVASSGGELGLLLYAKRAKLKRLVLPRSSALFKFPQTDVELLPVGSLSEAVALLRGERTCKKLPLPPLPPQKALNASPSIAQYDSIVGHEAAKRALQVAAAGGHNLNLIGPPGSGKTMLAMALRELLPELDSKAAIETAQIHAVHGKLRHNCTEPPYRAPHHTVSSAALIGGGWPVRPGEVTLAHRGVLFLDELLEFRRDALEALREPLQSGEVHLRRVAVDVRLPARFQLATALNPCPCGNFGSRELNCSCPPHRIERYQRKLSGPLIDRIDLHLWISSVPLEEIRRSNFAEQLEPARKRVREARKRQHERLGNAQLNAQMSARDIRRHCPLDSNAEQILERAIQQLGLSTRASLRIVSLSRSIADLDGRKDISREHLLEALSYRRALRKLQH